MRRVAAMLMAAGSMAAQEIPDHPDKIRFPDLRFEAPVPENHRVLLPPGVPCYFVENPTLPLVELQLYVRGGNFHDPPGKEGITSLGTTVLRTGGTRTRTPQQLDDELDTLSAELDISAGEVSCNVRLSVLAKRFDKALEIMKDVLRNPAFREERIRLARAQMIEGLKARNDRTNTIEEREVNLLLYGDFPINRLPVKDSLDSITQEDLFAWHRRFHPGNFILAVAGKFDRKEMARLLEGFLADWPVGESPAPLPPVSHKTKRSVFCFHKEGRQITQGRVTIGHLGISWNHPDAFAVRVMSYILGQGSFTSRLVQKVRAEKGLAYSVASDYRPGVAYPGSFRIQFQSKNETCLYALKLCLEELEKMRREEVSKNEVDEAVRFFVEGFPAFFFSTPFHTAQTLAQAELHGLPPDYYRTWVEKMKKVTPRDVLEAARRHVRPEELVFVFVGNIPAIQAGGKKVAHDGGEIEIRMEDFGPVHHVPLPDPLTLRRPG